MDNSQVPSWLTAIGTIALALVAAFLDQIRNFIARPRLLVQFRQAPPLCRLSAWRSAVNPDLEEPVYAFHFEVRNEGRSQARRVEAVVEELWIFDAAGNPRQIEDFSPVNLRYGGPGTRFADLNPGRRLLWNIGHISSRPHQDREERRLFYDVRVPNGHELRFLLDLAEYPNRQVNCFIPGRYALKASFYSENAARVDTYLEIVWSGEWRDNQDEMFREIVITQRSSIGDAG